MLRNTCLRLFSLVMIFSLTLVSEGISQTRFSDDQPDSGIIWLEGIPGGDDLIQRQTEEMLEWSVESWIHDALLEVMTAQCLDRAGSIESVRRGASESTVPRLDEIEYELELTRILLGGIAVGTPGDEFTKPVDDDSTADFHERTE